MRLPTAIHPKSIEHNSTTQNNRYTESFWRQNSETAAGYGLLFIGLGQEGGAARWWHDLSREEKRGKVVAIVHDMDGGGALIRASPVMKGVGREFFGRET
ncbi:hypothetical protein V6N13_061309 [Hibiscus sabdariffa]